MDEKALQIVKGYIAAHLDKSDPAAELRADLQRRQARVVSRRLQEVRERRSS